MERLPAVAIEVIDETACSFWTEQVLILRDHWTARHESLPFYTLGLAAYLDARPAESSRESLLSYRNETLRKWSNSLLKKYFSPLLLHCCEAITRLTDLQADLEGGQSAMPGFHIHLPHAIFAHDVASKHVDLQFKHVFPSITVLDDDVITFTLPLSLPQGAGLRVWEDEQQSVYRYELAGC